MKTTLNLPPFNPRALLIAALVVILSVALFTSCEKSDVAPIQPTPITKGEKRDVSIDIPKVGGKY